MKKERKRYMIQQEIVEREREREGRF